jgi:hypothetical protein
LTPSIVPDFRPGLRDFLISDCVDFSTTTTTTTHYSLLTPLHSAQRPSHQHIPSWPLTSPSTPVSLPTPGPVSHRASSISRPIRNIAPSSRRLVHLLTPARRRDAGRASGAPRPKGSDDLAHRSFCQRKGGWAVCDERDTMSTSDCLRDQTQSLGIIAT